MSETVVGKQLSVIQIEGLKCAFVGIVFLTRTPGSHWWITLLRAVAGSRFVCFPFVTPDTGIPEDSRAQNLRGPPSSCLPPGSPEPQITL